jgi:uncharacterized protein YbaR (Trm112 family)
MNASELLTFVVCPKCRGRLSQNEQPAGLTCDVCALFYPIEDGLPHLLIEEAKRWPLSESPSS